MFRKIIGRTGETGFNMTIIFPMVMLLCLGILLIFMTDLMWADYL